MSGDIIPFHLQSRKITMQCKNILNIFEIENLENFFLFLPLWMREISKIGLVLKEKVNSKGCGPSQKASFVFSDKPTQTFQTNLQNQAK